MEEDLVFSEALKYKGTFNFRELYELIQNWCVDERYRPNERVYEEKVLGDHKNINIDWECSKKISDYFSLKIKIKWTVTDLKKVEPKKNEKKEINSGTLAIKFAGVILNDYQNAWEGYPVLKFLRGFYDKYIIEERISYYKKKLKTDIEELISLIKSFLYAEELKRK